jgi:hypothetical protein
VQKLGLIGGGRLAAGRFTEIGVIEFEDLADTGEVRRADEVAATLMATA